MSDVRTATRTAIGRPPRLPTLGDVVERLWYVEDPACGGDEIKLPTSTPQVVLNLESDLLTTRDVRAPHHVRTSGAVGLAPLATRAVILDRSEQRRSVGIVLRPEAFSVTAGGSPHGLPPLVDLATLRGHAVSELAEKAAACATGSAALDVVEAEFARLVADAARPDPLARNAVALLSKGVRVSAVADQVGLTAGSDRKSVV